jgi:hypothetical protein
MMLNTIDISSQELINFYNSKFYFSYSSLNKLLFSPKMFYKHYVLREREESLDSHLVEGRLLHCLLLEPEKFDDYFTIVPGKVPSGNNKQIVHDIFNKYNSEELSGKTLNDFEDDIIQVLLSMNLHQTLKTDQQRIDKILISDNIDYFNFLINKGNRTAIDQETKTKVEETLLSIKSERTVMSLMNTEQALNELELAMDLENYSFGLKGIVDNLSIDFASQVIFINDLKTTGKPIQKFPETVDYYRYDLQAAIYLRLVKHYLKNNYPESANWKIVFTFNVVDNYNQVYPFQVSENTMNQWQENLNEVLKIAQYHYDNKDYNLPYSLATYSVTL